MKFLKVFEMKHIQMISALVLKQNVIKEWLSNTLKNNTIRCKKLTTIVSGLKEVTRPFVKRKQVSTSIASTMMFFYDA